MLDHPTRHLLCKLISFQLYPRNAAVKLSVNCLFADDAVDDVCENGMIGESDQATVALGGLHLVDRSKGHMRRRKFFADQIGQNHH